MAKLSQIKLGSTTYDIGAAWGNISGKPSSFPPSSHTHDFIMYKDTRSDNQSPDDVQAGLTVHLKGSGTDGLSDGGSYHAILNVKDWGDYSGGPYWQSTVTANNNMYFRRSTAGTTWGNWQKILSDNNYTDYTVTKTGSGASGTWGINITGNAATATKATQDGAGNVITSKYVTLDTAQTISGTKTMTGSLKVSGRYAGGGDDEGIIVGFANNGYAGLCLGGPSEARSVFYFKSDGTKPFWRYNNGTAGYDIMHPEKSGTIALTSDIPTSMAWSSITGKPSSFTPSSHTHDYIAAKGNYTFNASTLPNSFDLGVSAGFVSSDSGFGNYGSVLTTRTYSGGGGTLQLYAPYSPTYGGTRLKARFGNYDNGNGNSWTELKELAWTSDLVWNNIAGKPSAFNPDLPLRLKNYSTSGSASVDDATEQGFHYITGATSRPNFSTTNATDYRVLTTAYSSSWLQQIATDFRCNDIFYRRRENGTWKSWVQIQTTESADARYAKLASPNNLVHSSNEITMVPDAYSGDVYLNYRTASGNTNGAINTYRFCKGNGGDLANITASSFIGSLSGNASTATRLQTARTISLTGSVTGSGSFDGSGNLSIATTTNHTHSYLPLAGGTLTGNLTISKGGARTIYNNGTESMWCGVNTDGTSWGLYNITAEKYIIRLNDEKVKSGYPIYGAVWNDYAEFRICKNDFKPGQVVSENGDDTLSIASQRLQRGCSIISDTFGFAIGETDEAKCPIAVSGRVLAYGYESREEFKKHIGWPVCSGPNGTVSIMTEEEEEKYPSRIIGIISAVPDYETWGTSNIKVNNRIWIKIK